MTTPQTIIDRATSILRVRTSGVTFSTDDANKNADCFTALQEMISEWGEDGIVDIPAPSTLTEDLSIPEGSARALAWNLASEVGSEFGRPADQVILGQAKATKDRLRAQTDMDISIDMSDLNFAQGTFFNIRTGR